VPPVVRWALPLPWHPRLAPWVCLPRRCAFVRGVLHLLWCALHICCRLLCAARAGACCAWDGARHWVQGAQPQQRRRPADGGSESVRLGRLGSTAGLAAHRPQLGARWQWHHQQAAGPRQAGWGGGEGIAGLLPRRLLCGRQWRPAWWHGSHLESAVCSRGCSRRRTSLCGVEWQHFCLKGLLCHKRAGLCRSSEPAFAFLTIPADW